MKLGLSPSVLINVGSPIQAPSLSGVSIGPQIFSEDTGTRKIAASTVQSVFLGDVDTYNLVNPPANVTINSLTGEIDIVTANPMAATTISFNATNTGGTSPTATFSLTITAYTPPPDPDPEYIGTIYATDDNGPTRARSTTTSTFNVDENEFSVTLNSARKVGHFITGNNHYGDIWILVPPGETAQITSYTPAFTTTPRSSNGAMKNVTHVRYKSQGFDSRIVSSRPYSDTVRAAVPISLQAGDTVVIAKSDYAAIDKQGSIWKYMVITAVAEIPYVDEYRPPYSWPTPATRPRFRRSDTNPGLLPTLSHAKSPPSRSELLDPHRRFFFDPNPSWDRYSMEASPRHRKGYARELLKREKDSVAYLLSEASFADKTTIYDSMVQRGIDCWGVINSFEAGGLNPWYFTDGANHQGRFPWLVFLAKVANRPDIMDYATVPMGWQEPDNTAYVSQQLINDSSVPNWDGQGGGTGGYPYPQGMLGVPEYCGTLRGTVTGQFNNLWSGGVNVANYYRTTGGCSESEAEYLMLITMAKAEMDGFHPAMLDYMKRHFYAKQRGGDPWQFQGGAEELYPLPHNWPTTNYTISQLDYAAAMVRTHDDTYHKFPWNE